MWFKIISYSILFNTLLFSSTNKLDEYRKNINEYICAIPSYVDYKISNSKKIKNDSKAIFETIISKEESKKIEFETKLKLKLKLPNTKEKLQVTIYENKNNTKNKDLDLSYNIIKNFHQSLKASLGFEIKSKIDLYLQLKYNLHFEYNLITTNIYQSFRYYKDKGLVSTSFISFMKDLSNKYAIINNNSYTKEFKINENTLTNTLSLRQIINLKNLFFYEIETNRTNKDKHLSSKDYRLRFRYKHYFKEWIFFELVPELIYYYENNYKSTKKIGFKFNIVF